MNLLFDLDGTLTDPKPGISACVRHAMAGLGRPLPEDEDLGWLIGPPLQASFALLLGSHAQVPAAMGLYRARYQAAGLYENRVYGGIPEALAGLSRSAALFVATSKPTVFAREIVRHFGLAGHFQAVHGCEHDGTRSDKGELIRWILAQEGLDPARTWMIGDREHDLIGAKANGLRGVGVAWGYGKREDLFAAGAAAVLERPKELEAYAWG